MHFLHCLVLILAAVRFGLATPSTYSQNDLNEYCTKDGLNPGPDCTNYVTAGSA